jgi:hypothetical protein
MCIQASLLKFRLETPIKICADFGLSPKHLMNIAASAYTTHAPKIKSPLPSSQRAQEFASLQNALQNGDLAAACGPCAEFWQEVAS